jgi:hypothetical protein
MADRQVLNANCQMLPLPHHPRQLTSAAIHPIIFVPDDYSLLTRWLAVNEQNKNARRPFQTAGERLDDVLGDASKRIEQETQQLIKYINDELVPAIRDHSTNALRIASEKLTQAADMMDSNKRNKP